MTTPLPENFEIAAYRTLESKVSNLYQVLIAATSTIDTIVERLGVKSSAVSPSAKSLIYIAKEFNSEYVYFLSYKKKFEAQINALTETTISSPPPVNTTISLKA